MPEQQDILQIARGSYIAQAAPGGTATVVHYEFAPAAPVDDETLASAAQALERLPTKTVPGVAPLPPSSRMPLEINPLFTGRHAELHTLAAILKPVDPGRGEHPCAAVSGIPGSGKTQVASEFVHRYGRFFVGGVYWLPFADPSAIASEIAVCGSTGRMDLRPDFRTLPLEDRTRLVMSAWQSELPRLLVFDNCEDERLLAQWRPPSGGCRVLVTSRREQWDPALGVAVVTLDVLDRNDSIALLQRYRRDLASDDPAVASVAAELGDLPLALHLAGSYLWRYRQAMTAEAYLVQLRRPDLLAHRSLTHGGISPTGHEQHVARTFALSYDRLDATTPTDALAAGLLARAAHFAPGDVIPRDLLVASTRNACAHGEDDLDTQLAAEDALARLVELGLLQTAENAGLRLHRLVSAYVLDNADVPEAREAVEDQLLATFQELEAAGNLIRSDELEPHLRAVTDRALARPPDYRTRTLCNALGGHLRASGDFGEAAHYLQRGLECAVAVLGPEDPALAWDLNDLGLTLLRDGDLVGARTHLEAALPRWQKLNDQPNYAATLDNLGQLAIDEGDSVTAEGYFSRALAIREAILGPLDPRTAVTLTNLGQLLQSKGNIDGALKYFARALDARLRTLGDTHPATGLSLLNEGVARHLAGDVRRARDSLERAVHAYSATLGENHPRTLGALTRLAFVVEDEGDQKAADELLAMVADRRTRLVTTPSPWASGVLNNVGFLLWTRGEFVPACETYLDALTVGERFKGQRHPALITVLNNLGMVWQWLEDYVAARLAYERALEIIAYSRAGPTELSARVSNNYGMMLLEIGELGAARERLETAHADRTRLLGEEHPETALTLSNLGVLLQNEGSAADACPLTERAVSIVRQTPSDRRILAQCLHAHGVVLREAGRSDRASAALGEALRLREAALNALHPDTALTLSELADVMRLEDAVTARDYLARALGICDARLGRRPYGGRAEHRLTVRIREALVRLEAEASQAPAHARRDG